MTEAVQTVRLYIRNPTLSLGLLSITYACLSWRFLVAAVTDSRSLITNGLLALILTVVVAGLFSMRIQPRHTSVTRQIIGTDVRSFLFSIVGAFLTVLMFAWLELTTYALVLVVAQGLAKFELKLSGRNRWQMFILMTSASGGGVVVAVLAKLIWLKFAPVAAPE